MWRRRASWKTSSTKPRSGSGSSTRSVAAAIRPGTRTRAAAGSPKIAQDFEENVKHVSERGRKACRVKLALMGEVIKLNNWQGHAQPQERLPAVIRTSGAQSVAGTVTELSADGACIEVAAVPLPGFFLLEIADGRPVERICRVVWRDERRLSVRF